MVEIIQLLKKQLEQAKIEEVEDEMYFYILDKAVPPETRIYPKRKKIVTLSFIASVIFALCFIVTKEYIKVELDHWRKNKTLV